MAQLPPHGHDPAPRERFEPPAAGMVLRGAFLAAAAGAAALAAGRAIRGGPAKAMGAPPLLVASSLLAWAALIHLGGGAKFDDHPWV